MDQRGFTLIELLIALSAASVILLAMGGFYVKMLGASNNANGQVFLQRQGTLILEELARKVHASTGVLPWPCGPAGVTKSFAFRVPESVDEPAGYFCVYYDNEDQQLFECTIAPDAKNPPTASSRDCVKGKTRNLLGNRLRNGLWEADGSPVSLRADGVALLRRDEGHGAFVCFILHDQAGALQSLPFVTQMTIRN